MKKIVLLAVVLMLLSTALIVKFVRPVEASGTIYIKADGSVEPSTANITSTDNVTYYFTDNNYDEIVVERGNIVIDGAGYTLQGTGSEIGIYLFLRSNVTIKNMEIKNFWAGIQLSFSSNNRISGNNITAFDYYGILMDLYASHNTISGNTITAPSAYERHGIYLGETSGNNIISGNYIDGWFMNGIMGEGSSNNIISGNTLKNSVNAIFLDGGSNNRIYNNNFINHAGTTGCYLDAFNTTLDAGYPLGGNYWDKYNGSDLFSGLFQNETDSDGIGDTPYFVDGSWDNYPLMGMFYNFTIFMPPYPSEGFEHVTVISNSTVSNLNLLAWLTSPNEYLQPGQEFIRFDVTGEEGSVGFCRVMIPKVVLNGSYIVLVNWNEVTVTELPISNSTHAYLYFTHTHSTQEVIIIPEFPTWVSILLTLIAVTVVMTIIKRRKPKRHSFDSTKTM